MRTELALPTDPAESFVREVDENLRRDQAQDFLKKNGPWIVGAVLLFLAAVAGYLYWQDRQLKASEADTEKLNEVMVEIGGGQIATAEKDLPALQGSKSEGISAAARLTHAALLLDKSDRKAAMDEYRAVANDKDLAQPYRDMAMIRLTALEFDQIKPEDVISRLETLAKPGNPWFGSAGELTAMAMLKQGKKSEAGRMFAAMAADKQVPITIRSRAVQIAGTLGVDATASLPAAAR
ncbi:tetratricopeptide repeat protein [Sphingomonas alba]|uniref:Tetratricopeptide repeat protein n=1 Tax=Sphingomonas alba TaxID=2908208 RepID=A0ABT0RL53_9SPHN|nr:tetratricopeptide repeat protein [Sphingomonas alba]MCL6683371.1 tetratricopeptide repeat protein [Sphingomonas alba]